MMKNVKRKGLKLHTDEMRILDNIDAQKNGAFVNIIFETDCNDRIASAYRNLYNVTKTITMSIRKGIDYEKTKKVIAKRKSGIQKSKKMWYHHIDKTLVKHNDKDQYYILCFPNPHGKPHVKYKLNGKTIDKNKLYDMDIMQPSFWKKDIPDCITIKLDNIIAIYSNSKRK